MSDKSFYFEPAMIGPVEIVEEKAFVKNSTAYRISLKYMVNTRKLHWYFNSQRLWPPDPNNEHYVFYSQVYCTWPANDDAIVAFNKERDWMLHDEVLAYKSLVDTDGLVKDKIYVAQYVSRYDIKADPYDPYEKDRRYFIEEVSTKKKHVFRYSEIIKKFEFTKYWLHRPSSTIPEISY